MAKYSLAMT